MDIDWKDIYGEQWKEEPESINLANDIVLGTLVPHKNPEFIVYNSRAITIKKKFSTLIKPLPWSGDYLMDLLYTLEWIVRDHRKIAYEQNLIHAHVRETWFQKLYVPDIGGFAHICFPNAIMQERIQYEHLWNEFQNLEPSRMSVDLISLDLKGKQHLWRMWESVGGCGSQNRETGKLEFGNWRCSRCNEEIPKSLKAFALLTKSPMAEINESD